MEGQGIGRGDKKIELCLIKVLEGNGRRRKRLY
jgi:hypothetical protein